MITRICVILKRDNARDATQFAQRTKIGDLRQKESCAITQQNGAVNVKIRNHKACQPPILRGGDFPAGKIQPGGVDKEPRVKSK